MQWDTKYTLEYTKNSFILMNLFCILEKFLSNVIVIINEGLSKINLEKDFNQSFVKNI